MTGLPGQTDVAIVGLGPVGAVLSNLLGDLGVQTVVLERAEHIHPLPRAVHFDGEVMRVFQTVGLAERIAQVSRINQGMQFHAPDGRLLLDWPRPQVEGPLGWHPSWRFHQPDVEAILRDGLTRWPSVQVALGVEVQAISQSDDGVMLTCRTHDANHRMTARHVIGCDGARSLVRKTIGGTPEDLGFHEPWLVVDAILTRPRPDLGDVTRQYCDPTGPATYVRGPGDWRRWEIALPGAFDPERELEQDKLWAHLSRWITPEDARIERAAIYTFRSVLAGRWRDRGLLIAGDAAHQTPPFMGQGLCAGVRDAANLAWKLAACLRGADLALLDSYQSERAPHARAYVQGAIDLGRLINATDPEAALSQGMRQADGSVRMASPVRGLGPGLSAGLGAGRTEHTGTLFPQPRIDGQRMDDRIGQRFCVLGAPGSFDPGDIPPEITHLELPQDDPALDGFEGQAVMLRPDRYIMGTAQTTRDLQALCDAATALRPA